MNRMFRKSVHLVVKMVNVFSGYRIWEKRKVPEIYD